MIVVVWAIIGLVTAMRAIAGFKVPITGDEAYYWEWSRHLAWGYNDHPPALAAVIAVFSGLGASPGWVRSGFVVCGVVAALAVAATATRLTNGDRRAGAAAALALTLTPLASIPFGSASPDGPYIAAWTVALWLTVRAFDARRRVDFALLGVALGAVILSRMFGFALLFGIAMYALAPARRDVWRAGLWLSFGVAGLCFSPFVVWNATHHWATFDFTFVGRHVAPVFSLKRVIGFYSVDAAAYSPGLFIGALLCAVRPRSALLAWTALPLIGLLTFLALFEPVEIHWIFGPYASLCVGLGIAYVRLSHRPRVIWASASLVPALLFLPLLFWGAVAPGQIYQEFRNSGSSLKNTGPFEIFTVWPLAQDVKRIAKANDAVVMTDGYGLSSTLDFDAGIAPVLIGYNAQGREAMRWYDPEIRPKRALFVDKEELAPRHPSKENPGRFDYLAQLERACGRVRSGGSLQYSYAGVPPRVYWLTWCDRPREDALHLLRWERGAPDLAANTPSVLLASYYR